MERVQFALQKQLKGAYDIAVLKLSEQSEELARQKRRREDVGVQLYQVQQQLAKLQMNLEKVHENHSIISQLREQAEGDLSSAKPTYMEKLRDVKEQRSKYDKYQSELDQLNMTLRQVEAYNDQMKSEIAVTRRATYKAEESITALESGKRMQDTLIDNLNVRLLPRSQPLPPVFFVTCAPRACARGPRVHERLAAQVRMAHRFSARRRNSSGRRRSSLSTRRS